MIKKLRIGIFSDTYPPEVNGVATVSELLYNVFTSHGHEVFVITTGEYIKGEKYVREGNIIRICAKEFKHMYNYKKAPLYRSSVSKLIKSLNLDLIHVQTEFGVCIFGRILAKVNHIPIVYTYHTMYEDYTYYVTKGIRVFDSIAKRLVADFSVYLTEKATEFTTTSTKTKDVLRKYGATKFINVIPNGIDLSLFTNTDLNEVEKLRKELNLDGKFIFLILGRLAKEKSNDIVLKNISALAKEIDRDKVKLLIVGDGPDKENLENIAKEEGIEDITMFIGKVPHEMVSVYYHLADMFLSASTSETQGLTFIEAMASETLVLAKRDECLLEVIIPNKTGYFFDTQDEFIKIVKMIMSYDAEELKRIKKEASELITEKYSAEKFYESMLHVYLRAVRKFW